MLPYEIVGKKCEKRKIAVKPSV